MKTVAIVNLKGGVGKTTTAAAVGAVLAQKDRVLLVDADPQANLTAFVECQQDRQALREAFTGKGAKPVASPWGLDVIPSSRYAVEIDTVAVAGGLRKTLATMPHDWCLVDCGPALSVTVMECLAAADAVLVPVEASVIALSGLPRIAEAMTTAGKVKLAGVLVTMYRPTVHAREVLSHLRQEHGRTVFHTVVPLSVAAQEAVGFRVPVTKHAPRSSVAKAYRLVTDELRRRMR